MTGAALIGRDRDCAECGICVLRERSVCNQGTAHSWLALLLSVVIVTVQSVVSVFSVNAVHAIKARLSNDSRSYPRIENAILQSVECVFLVKTLLAIDARLIWNWQCWQHIEERI